MGSHTLTAVFTPDSASFTGSTSAPATLVVNAAATVTTTTLAVTPASPQVHGTPLTLTATVTPADAAGSVQFLDGTTVLGTTAVTVGAASLDTSSLATGSHSLTAKFVPTSTAAFTASTSAAVTYSITAAPATPTTTTLVVDPSGGAIGQHEQVTLTANGSPSGAAGSVKFLDGTFVLATVPVSGGTATFSTKALGLGDHSLTAQFVPTNAADFDGSTSDAVALNVHTGSTGAPVVGLVVKDAAGHTVADGATLAGGAKLTITGSGFTAGESVTVTLHSTEVLLVTVTANGSGNASAAVTVPKTCRRGSHHRADRRHVHVDGRVRLRGGWREFAHADPDTDSHPDHGWRQWCRPVGRRVPAATGADLGAPLLLALGLLVAGGALVLATRRGATARRSRQAR